MEIVNNLKRVGNFTSSSIVNLMSSGKTTGSFGKPFYSYINEKNKERRLGRSISNESNARQLTWGKLLEVRVFELLGIEYKYSATDTVIHPTIPYWSGSADGEKFDKGKTIIDIKCPQTLNSFCDLVDGLYKGLTGMEAMNYARDNHADGDTYYYQLVSNAIIHDAKYAELIIYVPYFEELAQIKEMASNQDVPNPFKFLWIFNAQEEELPYLIKGKEYKNLNVIRFEIPPEDKIRLTERVKEANKLLIKNPNNND